MKFKLISTMLLFLLIAACSSQNMGLSTVIDAGILANEYAKDIKAGNQKYKGKYLTVQGKVEQAYKNKHQQSIIILLDSKKINGVKCVLVNSSKQLNAPLKQGAILKINGRCSGFAEYVNLEGCIILKN